MDEITKYDQFVAAALIMSGICSSGLTHLDRNALDNIRQRSLEQAKKLADDINNKEEGNKENK